MVVSSSGRTLRVHPVRLLQHLVPLLLVEWRQVPGARRADAGLPLDHRLQGQQHQGAPGQAQGPLLCLPVPHHHELHQNLPKGAWGAMLLVFYYLIAVIVREYKTRNYFLLPFIFMHPCHPGMHIAIDS